MSTIRRWLRDGYIRGLLIGNLIGTLGGVFVTQWYWGVGVFAS